MLLTKPKTFLSGKKGSYTIFITFIFTGILILVLAVIWASIEMGISSTANDFGKLWGQSIIAEYDRFLHDRYRLYSFSGNEYDTARKIDYYAKNTFDKNNFIKYEDSTVSLEGYELTDLSIFKEQIEEAVMMDIKPIPRLRIKSDVEKSATTSGYRYVTAGWIKNQLPSENNETYLNVTSIINAIKNRTSVQSLVENTAINQYIFSFFKCHTSDDELGDTFFKNEIEYILTGKLNDDKARKEVYAKLLLIRTGLNAYHIRTSTEKSNACLTVGIILFPEIGPYLAQQIIIESWSAMEANNDIKLLYAGKKVPFLKNDENFALSLSSVIRQEYGCDLDGNRYRKTSTREDYVEPRVVTGETYEGYLKLLLGFVSESTKLYRMMDLIQLNGKYLYVDYFNINEYYTGLSFSYRVNGKIYEFEESYKK